jgi:hypothetical protein
MTRSILVTGVCIVALAGCTRTLVRETVVEKPVAPVASERIIERPAVVATVPASCSLGGAGYASGSMSCQEGYQYRCDAGVWTRIQGSYC